jgi:hypothetical protein
VGPEIFVELRNLKLHIGDAQRGDDGDRFVALLNSRGVSIPRSEIPKLSETLFLAFGRYGGSTHLVPPLLLPILERFLAKHPARIVCDPWAGLGELLANAAVFARAAKALAFTQNEAEFALGRALVGSAEWKLGDPLKNLETLGDELDLVVSVVPFGARTGRSITLKDTEQVAVELRYDLGNLIVAAATAKLSKGGLALHVFVSRQGKRRCSCREKRCQPARRARLERGGCL